MKELIDKVRTLKKLLSENKKIELISFKIYEDPDRKKNLGLFFNNENIAEKIKIFYHQFDGFYCKWKSLSNNADISGCANFLKSSQIMLDHKGLIYQDDIAPDARVRNFHPIDFFNDEACVGFYIGEDKNDSMYFYDLIHEPKNLQLDIQGYFELMIYMKAFRYWQYLMIEILMDDISAIGNIIRQHINELFPDVDLAVFKELYQKYRLDIK